MLDPFHRDEMAVEYGALMS